jgi:hypothetical protein
MIPKEVFSAANLISHALAKSIARPREFPWSAAMTGARQLARVEIAPWKSCIISSHSLRAGREAHEDMIV